MQCREDQTGGEGKTGRDEGEQGERSNVLEKDKSMEGE